MENSFLETDEIFPNLTTFVAAHLYRDATFTNLVL